MQKSVHIVAPVLIEGGHKCAETSICSKQVWSNPDIRAKTRVSRYRTGFTINETLSRISTESILTRRLSDHKPLNVSMLTAIAVSWFAEPELERDLFPRISVQVEPERVETFWMKRIRSRCSRI